MGQESIPEDAWQSESGRSLPPREKVFITDRSLQDKIDLMTARLRSMDTFRDLSLTDFTEHMPGFRRLMPLLAQSVVDISHSLLRRNTTRVPRSYYDIIDSCEQTGILPASLVRPLARQLVLIDNGLDSLDGAELEHVHKELLSTIRVFQDFLEHSQGILTHPRTT